MQFVAAVRSNVLGLNGPLIAAIEGAYDELWARNVTALVGYHGGASAAAADVGTGQSVPAVGEVARAVDYDVQTAARLVADDAALPARLVSTDLRMLVGLPPEASLPTSPAEPSSLEHHLAVKAAQIAAVPGEMLRADETLIGHVVDDNVTELGKAATITGNDPWAAQADLAAGDPMKAANDVASASSYDAATVVGLAAEDAALPISLAATDLAIIGAAQS
ncbi:PPE domain-containing protein [Mycobacterium persicum]|uniref:PPE domain-containing protein n=1 Tax=Mycobacterium persicum TaxID=1487726 RepID=UPI000C06F446|nr:PPE domain-containing protein [Mycobacterium persicum]